MAAEPDEVAEAVEPQASDLVGRVADALAAGRDQEATALVADLAAPDLADLIELLDPEARIALIQALGPAFDYEVLSELEEGVRDQLSEALPNELLEAARDELEEARAKRLDRVSCPAHGDPHEAHAAPSNGNVARVAQVPSGRSSRSVSSAA